MFFSTGQMLKRRTYQQALLKKVESVIFPQKFFPHSTGVVEKFWSVKCLLLRLYVLFLTGKKSTKRIRPKGRYENAPPLETPAATPSDTRKCPDFRASTERNLPAFFIVGVQKSEHFWTPAGEAAGGVHRGGRIFVAPPLWRILWLLSWRDKKVILPQRRLQTRVNIGCNVSDIVLHIGISVL